MIARFAPLKVGMKHKHICKSAMRLGDRRKPLYKLFGSYERLLCQVFVFATIVVQVNEIDETIIVCVNTAVGIIARCTVARL